MEIEGKTDHELILLMNQNLDNIQIDVVEIKKSLQELQELKAIINTIQEHDKRLNSNTKATHNAQVTANNAISRVKELEIWQEEIEKRHGQEDNNRKWFVRTIIALSLGYVFIFVFLLVKFLINNKYI